MRLAALFVVMFIASCGHTAPFVTADNGAVGPQVPAAVARLTTSSASSPTWTADGAGILYQFAKGQLVFTGDHVIHDPDGTLSPIDSNDQCLGLLPAPGGSRIWTLCDTQFAEGDSINLFSAAAIQNNGTVIYQEMTGRIDFFASRNYPIAFHAELWLADTATPFVRRKVLALYPSASGILGAPDTQVNWLTTVSWIGPTSFLAIAEDLDANADLTPLGLVVGTIGASGTTLQIIPGTAAVNKYSLAEGGNSVVFSDSTLVLSRVPIMGGAPTAVATIPSATGRAILDVSCSGTSCVTVTQESEIGPGLSSALNLWTVNLSSGTVGPPAPLPPTGALNDAAIAPGSHAVVGREGSTLFLITPGKP